MTFLKMIKTTLKLHYSQTYGFVFLRTEKIKTTLKLHYSQTFHYGMARFWKIKTTLKLHYSQTSNSRPYGNIHGYEPLRECNFTSILEFAQVNVNSQPLLMRQFFPGNAIDQKHAVSMIQYRFQ